MANDCLKRSFTAGFKWANRQDAVPDMHWEEDAKSFAHQYGLRFTKLDDDQYYLSNNPAILIYSDNYKATDCMYHAVFLSDTAILKILPQKDLYAVIDGFERLAGHLSDN